MNYTVKDKFYIANEGYVFHSTITDIYTKRVMLPKPEYLEVYEIVDEASIPVVDPEVEPVEPEVVVDPDAATEADYIGALEELGVNFNE